MQGFLKPHKRPLLIAHRGASADAPENTLAAFRLAINQGADAIELDVQQTLDKKLVIMHDPSLSRTTNGRGWVSRKSFDYIKTLDAGGWFDNKYTGEPVPRLEDVLDSFGTKTHYVIELKFYRPRSDRFASRVYDAVASRGLIDKVLFLSFDPRLLAQIKKNNPQALTCWAFLPLFGFRPPQWLANKFDVLAIAATKANPTYIEKLQKLGKPVNIWAGVGRPEDHDQEINCGAEFITTNSPGKLKRLLARRRDVT